ncbi:MAG TPA: hypothetical protein VN697_03350 [Tepidiformaceae bacterium]|nr:hypothetical protein [Tepidiformaceae bacterium]
MSLTATRFRPAVMGETGSVEAAIALAAEDGEHGVRFPRVVAAFDNLMTGETQMWLAVNSADYWRPSTPESGSR